MIALIVSAKILLFVVIVLLIALAAHVVYRMIGGGE
jgi:hypothetical protein